MHVQHIHTCALACMTTQGRKMLGGYLDISKTTRIRRQSVVWIQIFTSEPGGSNPCQLRYPWSTCGRSSTPPLPFCLNPLVLQNLNGSIWKFTYNEREVQKKFPLMDKHEKKKEMRRGGSKGGKEGEERRRARVHARFHFIIAFLKPIYPSRP